MSCLTVDQQVGRGYAGGVGTKEEGSGALAASVRCLIDLRLHVHDLRLHVQTANATVQLYIKLVSTKAATPDAPSNCSSLSNNTQVCLQVCFDATS